MKLADDVTRCLGLLPAPMGTLACMRRQSCARYVQRHDGSRMSMWLCPTEDAYYGMYVPTETQPGQSAATTGE